MEHGLLWFPLLAIFIWLFWQGGREYQKVEAYHLWAEKFDRAKYDLESSLNMTIASANASEFNIASIGYR